ncbi:hypothetical protein [Mycobacterium sp. SMC-4]|uniref:hypothetical protein n=1 Tax=Mycobacterium sp. SMC-4 TaxID=2857059 RepID=UPI0021B25F2B|nr:hypothetical protein [Mycobacterium sp. SMC-4]UXA19809.1 hypothetical protein KXD98_09575 [Mycobacterium sp. SMC-4]
MFDHLEFDVTGYRPTLQHYRRDWTPGPGLALAGIWIGAVVSDSAGNTYWGVRGCDDFIAGMTHVVSPICGFRKLPKQLDAEASHLFTEYSTLDWFEPMMYTAAEDSVALIYPSGRIERKDSGFHWVDASNRWELHGHTVSDAVVTQVPRQEGIADDVCYRHELMYLTGTIDGVEVSGYGHQDFAYGPPGKIYTELPIARHLQGMWVSWLHEYTDGEFGGGSFWQGRDGISFGPGYLLEDGVTTTYKDIETTEKFNEAGKMTELHATFGSATYSFDFDSSGSPLHVFGPLTSAPTGKECARSWCWVEYSGNLLNPELLDAANAVYALARGK